MKLITAALLAALAALSLPAQEAIPACPSQIVNPDPGIFRELQRTEPELINAPGAGKPIDAGELLTVPINGELKIANPLDAGRKPTEVNSPQ